MPTQTKLTSNRLACRYQALIVVAITLLCLAILGVVAYWLTPKPFNDLQHAHYANTKDISGANEAFSKAIFDRNGKLLHLSLSADDKYRLYTPLNQIPQSLIDATILYEDQNFYTHWGVDTFALFRAFYQSYVLKQRKIGASTLPMQVARLVWRIDSSTISGKIQQILRALQLVRHYDKAQILELYLNAAPYGGNIEGVGAASLIYFQKKVTSINPLESITLAVVPQNPNKRNPELASNAVGLQQAKQILYQRNPELFPSLDIATISMPINIAGRQQLPSYAPHFTDFIKSLDVTRSKQHKNVTQQSQYYITTTLDLNKQHILQDTLNNYIATKRDRGLTNASALLLNYKTMNIEAMLGSADFHNTKISGQVNGTISKRSPGSTLKPLLYGLAMDAGLIHPGSIVKDLPKRYAAFSPDNADSQFLGPISATKALVSSRNLPAVELQKQLTLHSPENDLYSTLQKTSAEMLSPDYYGLALSLGGIEISMWTLVEMYASFANNGFYLPSSVVLSNDLNLHSNAQHASLLTPEASFLVLDMLRQHSKPANLDHPSYAHLGKVEAADVAWKTGTSWGFRDGWAIGVSGDYVIAVWVGNFSGQGNPIFKGGETAGPLMFKMLQTLTNRNYISDNWKIESLFDLSTLNVKSVDLCAQSGVLFTSACPTKTKAWFIPGVSPIQHEPVYTSVLIHQPSGLRACSSFIENTKKQTFALWPSDIAKNFAAAAKTFKPIPKLHPNCANDISNGLSTNIVEPNIISPQQGMTYVATMTKGTDQAYFTAIPMQVSADGQASEIKWFVNSKFITKLKLDQDFAWDAPLGKHTIMAVDDKGGFSSVQISVVR